MSEKLTLDEFNSIIKKLNNRSYSINEKLSFQGKLLSSDLSNIPFTEWGKVTLITDGNTIDFSKTKANIDFNIFKYLGNGNFKNCNITHLENFPGYLNHSNFDEKAMKDNKELFLSNLFSDEFKDKYYSRMITMDDLSLLNDAQINELKVKNIPHYVGSAEINIQLLETLGIEKILKIYKTSKKDYDAINSIYNNYASILYEEDKNIVDELKNTQVTRIKNVLFTKLKQCLSKDDYEDIDLEMLPKMFLEENIKKFNLDDELIDAFGIDNILKIENETKIFSICKNLSFDEDDLENFQNGNLSYEEFRNVFADLLNKTRLVGRYKIGKEYDYDLEKMVTKDNSYSFILGKFRQDFPDIFIDDKAPDKLKKEFYEGKLTFDCLLNHEYIPYIKTKNLSKLFNFSSNKSSEKFVYDYTRKFGNSKFISLVKKYNITGLKILNSEKSDFDFKSKEDYEKYLRDILYDKLCQNDDLPDMTRKTILANNDFRNEHPNVVIDLEALSNLNIPNNDYELLKEKISYNYLTANDVMHYPELVSLLKGKDLTTVLSISNTIHLLKKLNEDEILNLIAKYGKSFNYAFKIISENYDSELEDLSYEDVEDKIEKTIVDEYKNGKYFYNDDSPEIIKEKYPELYLDSSAPDELKNRFYNIANQKLTFPELRAHKEWLPYLEGKSVITALLKSCRDPEVLKKYFDLFGNEKALKLGINKYETVLPMLQFDNVELMKKWYDRTGQRFLPDAAIINNFDLAEADKFFRYGSNWTKLMQLNNYSVDYETKDGVLKLAYSFGVFDEDEKGLKSTIDILTQIPRKLKSNYSSTMKKLINQANNDALFKSFLNKAIEEENVQVNSDEPLLDQIYRKNDDNSYTLTINQQNCPKTTGLIRNLMAQYEDLPVLHYLKVHSLFSGFSMKYDKDFRDFLVNNIDEILSSPEYTTYLSKIQRQFSEIKAINSNRKLTLELAKNYVISNKYIGIQPGNELAADISATAGYSQTDFDVLQEIYNYGKQRTFSSIPRIEGQKDDYKYEMLRLDDALAMAIGAFTDCCQELGDVAEMCMEHSMVDKNGRVFVIKDSDNNIVAQSWVWRNKSVLCFDNIEIPSKAFNRALKLRSEHRDLFSQEVYDVYKQAAIELMNKDEEKYAKLLSEGFISKEQYDGLHLSKVTVGLGYNDIANTIKKNAKLEKDHITRPLPFDAPVKLKNQLYANDSTTQFILNENKDEFNYSGDTLPIYSDEYQEYDDSNFNPKLLLTLNKLEMLTKNKYSDLETDVVADNYNIVSSIAENYNLDPSSTKIVMNPNFAIIYACEDDNLKIGDLLYNNMLGDDKVLVMQIKLALDQISKDKKIDISKLTENQLEVFNDANAIGNEIEIEKGLGNSK